MNRLVKKFGKYNIATFIIMGVGIILFVLTPLFLWLWDFDSDIFGLLVFLIGLTMWIVGLIVRRKGVKMPHCSKCGAQIGEGDPSCAKCGASLAQVIPQSVVSPTVGRSGMAIAALVLGILAFVPSIGMFCSPGAIICGILGIRQTGVGKKRGRGLAIAGLVLGCIALVVWVGLIIWILLAIAHD